MITTETNKKKKQTSEQAKNKQQKQSMQQCICIALIQGNGKSLIKLLKLAAVSIKTLKIAKRLPKTLCNIDIMDLCLLP